MSDPHVVSLRYRFVSVNEHDRFTKAAPLSMTADGFDLHLEDGVLVVRPEAHFATEEEARAAIEPYLASWAAKAALERARREIRFDFEDADVIDRAPYGLPTITSTARLFAIALDATIVAGNGVYPDPPTGFRTDPVLDSIIRKIRDVDAGGATLTDAANWVSTRLEGAFGGAGKDKRRVAGRNLGLDLAILSNLGRLAAQNDPDIGRKAKGAIKPLTVGEKAWMRAAMVLVAEQVGAYNSGIPIKLRTMADLPTY